MGLSRRRARSRQQVIIDHFQTGRTETLDQGPEIPDEQCQMRLASQTKLTVGYV